MAPLRPALVLACIAVLLPAGLSGCSLGKKGAEHEEVREGLDVEVDGVGYNVFITRQLNIKQPPDDDFYNGPEPKPGRVLYGVFIKVCNITDVNRMPISRFIVEDTDGNEYRPVPIKGDNPFAYKAKELAPKECIPPPGSAGAFGPTGGAMLLFDLPDAAQENRPLELQLVGTQNLLEGERTERTIELDI